MFKRITSVFLMLLICMTVFTGIAIERSMVYDITALTDIDDIESPVYPVTRTVEEDEDGQTLIYKLLNLIPLKKVSTQSRSVYLGGVPLGINVKAEGLIITAKQDVITSHGIETPFDTADIKSGDILVSIDGVAVHTQKEIEDAVGDKDNVTVVIARGGKKYSYAVKTAEDVLTGRKKIGLWLRDGISGIGTLTYVDPSNMRYGALGHPIDESTEYIGGAIYGANIYGYIKGEKGKAGELSGSYDPSDVIGSIDKNNKFGIFGKYRGDIASKEMIPLGSKSTVKPGKAHIYTTIDGCCSKRYEIEIIKCNVQNKADSKGMVIRITDKELLERTNGILQGMSGSPIIQNGKLIGAVTHVFINDPTKGFGMYIDFMLPN
ncbi:MAG: SpoIVB peptidase [Clostridia bacterium]|nr:SpoIVB peptidase [Clostridia bacterium]